MYARLEGGPSVFTIAAKSIEALHVFPIDALAFFDRTILAVPAETVQRISLSRPGVEQSVSRAAGGPWSPAARSQRILDTQRIDDFLSTLANLRALRIEKRNPENLASYGLDAPAATITIGLSGREGIQKSVLIGFRAGTEGVYAMVRGQNVVFVMAMDVAERLSQDLVVPANANTPPSATPAP